MIVATFLGIDIHHGGALLVLGFLCLLCNSAVSTNDCVNVWKNSWECDDWARHDQCDVNPQWMLPNCKKSCLKCDQYDCNNAVDTSSKCRGWADTGECEVNEGWMVPNCRYACLRCEKYAAPGIFVSNETHVLKLQSETRKVDSIISQGACASIVGVAVDGQSLFWSDISDSHRGLYSSDYSGQRKIISEDILEVNGIALDWLSKHVYWADSQTRRIEVADYDGTNRRVLVNTGLFSPRGIVADPVNGYLYWNDQGTKKIERSRLDGSQREVLVDSGLTWPNQMAMDYSTGNLYWVDAWNKTLQYLTPGGTTVQVADLAGYVGSNPAFGLSLLGGMAYVSVWGSGKILSVAKTGGQVSTEFSDLGSAAMFSINSFNRSELPEIKHPCSFPRKGGCSHLCLPTVGQAYRCACPSKGGLVLSPGGTTCKEPDNVLLYTVADQSEVGFIDPDNPGTGDRYLVGRSSRPVAVTFDPITQRVYWSDVQERTVYRAFLNGTSQEVFLNASQGLGFVDGLALDWIHRKLYFTNEDFVTIDSTAFTWHKIEVIDLDTPMGNYGNSAAVNQWASRGRTAIVTNVEKPRGLWLDIEKGYLYYTDWGSRGTVTRTNLDGSNPLLLQSGMDNPNSVLLEKDQLFVVDSHAKKWEDGTAEKKGSLYFRNISREGWDEDKGPQLKVPYGMAKNGDWLYISDWGHKAILEYNMKNGTQRPLVAAGGDVMALLFTKTKQNAGSDKCRSSSCDQICITEPQTGAAQCHCSSYGFYTSASDSQTCTGFSVQRDFAVFADMSSIKKVDLPVQGKPQTSTLYEGNKYFSTYTGLVYDKSGQQVLFSDTTKKSIYQLNLKTGGASIYYQPCQVVDSMYLEPTAGTTRQLYWTASEAGIIASLPYSSPSLNHTVVVSGLDKPRAVTVIGEYIYWTEWGTKARVARVHKKGGNITTVLGTGLIRPSGLDYDSTSGKLYISDGHTGQIFRCSATGNPACEAVQVGSGKLGQIYDFVVNGQMLIYTDWRSHSLSAMDLQTGITRGLADGLMRPSQLALSGFISKVFVTIPAVVSSPTPGVTSSSGRTPIQTTTTTKTLSSPEPVLLVTPTKAADTSLPTSQAVGTSLQGHKSTVLVDRTTLLHSKQVPGFTSSKSTHIASLSTNLPDVTTPQVLIPSTSRSSTATSPGDTASTQAVFVTEVETTAKGETEPMTRKMLTPTKPVMTTKPVEAVGTTEGPSVTTLKAEAVVTTQRETKLPRTAPVQVPANATEQYIGTTEAELAESTSRTVMETTGTLEATSGRAKKTTLAGTSAIETDEPVGTGRTHVTTQSSLVFSSPSTTVTVTSQKAVQVSEAGKGTAEGVQTTFVLPKITTSILSVTNGTQVDITQKLSRQPILSSLGITTESSRTSVSRQGTTASSAGTKVPVIPVVTEQIPTRAATLSSSSVRAKPEITTKVSKPASTEAQMSTFVVESTEDFATSGKSTSKVIPTAILTEPEVRVGTTVGKSTTRTTTGRESTSKESHRSTSIQVTVETEVDHSTEQPKLTGVPHSSKTPDVVITEEGMRTSTAVPIKTRPGVSVVTDLKHTISQLPKTSLPSAVKENTTLLPSVPMKTTVSEAVQPPMSTLGVELGSTAGPVAHATTAGVETTAEGTTTTVAVSTQSPATSPEQPTTEHPPFFTVAVSTQSPATSPEQPTSEHPPFSTMKHMPTEPARPVVPTRADKENITMTAKPAENVTKISVSVTETPAITHQVDSTVVTGLATRRGTSAAAGTTVHLLTSKTSKIPDATPTATVLPMVNTSIDSKRQRNRSTIALRPTVLVSEKTTVVSSPLTTTLSTTQAIKSTVPVEETTVAVLPPTTESTSRLMTTDQGLQTTQKLTYPATTEASTTLSMAQATEETTQKATYPTTTETHTTMSMMQETTGTIHRTISKTTVPLTTKATTTTRPSTSTSAESTSTQLPESTVRKETTPEMRVQSTEVAETTKREASTRTPMRTTTRQIIVTEKPVMSSEGSTGVVTTTTTYTSTTAGPPPKFTFCPQNKTIISGGDTKEVWWQEPQVQDFNGSAVKQIDVNIQPGSVFKIGQTLVTYTATDRYGSTATCSFTVDIQRAKFDCTGTPTPNNGQLNCRRVDYLFHCQLSCNEGYRKNSQYDYTYVCRIAGWAPTFDPSFGTMACLKLTPLSYSQSLTIQFNGDCGKNEANFKKQMTEALIADFKAKKLCGSTKGSDPHGLCSPKNIAVVCGSSGGRQRRQTQGNGGIAVTFKVATQAGNSTAQKKGQAQLQELLENIRSMVSNNNLKLIVGDQQVVATGSTLGPAQQGCTLGSEQVENGCMVCAMGGHQNATGQCEACPAGTYQDKAAQTSCISCPQGTKSQRGSFTKAQCVSPQETTVKPTGVASKGRDQLEAWVVITICAVAGVIILISIIVCAIWIGRNLKHKYTGKMKMDHEKGIPNGRHVNYHNPAFVARPKSETTEKKTKDDTMPKYLVAQAPPQNLPQYRYQQLKPGTIVKVIPLENGGRKIVVVPKKPHSKKYEMKEAAKVTVSMQPDPAVQGKYIKNQGPPLAAAQAVPVVKVPVAAKPVPAQQKRSKGWTSLTDTDKTST